MYNIEHVAADHSFTLLLHMLLQILLGGQGMAAVVQGASTGGWPPLPAWVGQTGPDRENPDFIGPGQQNPDFPLGIRRLQLEQRDSAHFGNIT